MKKWMTSTLYKDDRIRKDGEHIWRYMKKIPLRKCAATGEMFPKKEMIRIVRSKEGEVSVDLTGKKSGRGTYVSKSEEAVNKCTKEKFD